MANKILTGLLIGSVRDSKDAEQLRANNITHIISIHDNARKGVHQDVEYLCIMASDTPNQNLSQFFSQCNDFIHSARVSGGSVLIHCLAGASRSVTIAAAYLMSVTSLNWKEALEAVRVARSISCPNDGFQKQLKDFEIRNLKMERKRLSLKFPHNVFRMSDDEEVRKLITSQHAIQSPDKGDYGVNTTSNKTNGSESCFVGYASGSSNSTQLNVSQNQRRSPNVKRKPTTKSKHQRENKTL